MVVNFERVLNHFIKVHAGSTVDDNLNVLRDHLLNIGLESAVFLSNIAFNRNDFISE